MPVSKVAPTAPAKSPRYRERYCAFLDILGFRELVDELGKDEVNFNFIQAMLNDVHNPPNDPAIAKRVDFRTQSISDAVAISTKVNPFGLLEIINAVERLTIDMLNRGYFVRGALVRGLLYHDDKMVFGEALIRAYQLESQIVKYPRVMLTSQAADEFIDCCRKETIPFQNVHRIRCAADGPWHIHVLRDGAIAERQIELLRVQLERKLLEAVDNPAHFEKVKWFVDYWNAVHLKAQILWPAPPPEHSSSIDF
jgi:hypothetical protein